MLLAWLPCDVHSHSGLAVDFVSCWHFDSRCRIVWHFYDPSPRLVGFTIFSILLFYMVSSACLWGYRFIQGQEDI
jgi:hypothetical protein